MQQQVLLKKIYLHALAFYVIDIAENKWNNNEYYYFNTEKGLFMYFGQG